MVAAETPEALASPQEPSDAVQSPADDAQDDEDSYSPIEIISEPTEEERIAGVLAPVPGPDDMDAELAAYDGDSYIDDDANGDDPFEEDF